MAKYTYHLANLWNRITTKIFDIFRIITLKQQNFPSPIQSWSANFEKKCSPIQSWSGQNCLQSWSMLISEMCVMQFTDVKHDLSRSGITHLHSSIGKDATCQAKSKTAYQSSSSSFLQQHKLGSFFNLNVRYLVNQKKICVLLDCTFFSTCFFLVSLFSTCIEIGAAALTTSPVVLCWMCDSTQTGCVQRTTYIYVARTSNNKKDCDAWSLLLLGATVWSLTHSLPGLFRSQQCQMCYVAMSLLILFCHQDQP